MSEHEQSQDQEQDAGAQVKGSQEKLLTQAEVTQIATREKNEGRQAAERAISEQLGVSIAEAAVIIKQSRDASDAKKSEADKDREAAAKEKQQAEAAHAAAKAELHQARLERAFAAEGLDLAADAGKTNRLLRLVTVQPGASFEDVQSEVKQIKADFPALFGEGEQQVHRAPSGDPKGSPPKPTGGEDKFSAGADRAKARYAGNTEASGFLASLGLGAKK